MEHPAIDLTFSSFVFSLSQAALSYLGELENPETGCKECNLELAKQNIDILGLLENKTSGNLTEDEGKLLKSLIYDLRIKYLDACSKYGTTKPATT